MSHQFSERQIRNEVALIKDGTLHRSQSDVYDTWSNLAAGWFAEDSDYLAFGFKGFDDRDADEIVEDLRNHDRVTVPAKAMTVDDAITFLQFVQNTRKDGGNACLILSLAGSEIADADISGMKIIEGEEANGGLYVQVECVHPNLVTDDKDV